MELLQRPTARTLLADEKIVELFWQRSENAIEETDLKYKKYLFTIAYNIVHDTLDCEECLNDTYIGAWNAMPPARPNLLKAFLTTIMRRVAVNRYHSNSKKSTVPSEMTVSLSEVEAFITEETTVEDAFDAVQVGKLISDYLRTLSERRRFVFMSRYYVANPIDMIAKELNLSRSTVNKELAFIRAGLKTHLEKEGYTV
jgi:RNA polymerase sigma-70 factor (ECF subfamily)